MTINSVTSNNGLYEAMVQQAAALRAAQESRPPTAQAAQPQTSQSSTARTEIRTSPEPDTFARSLAAQTRQTERRTLALPTSDRADSSQQFQKKVAGTYRSPWADANSLVVQTRSPGALVEAGAGNKTMATTPPPKPAAPKATFVEVHNVYADAAEEESGRNGLNPLFRFASQLYQNVVTTGRRSATGQFIGSSFSGVA